MAHILRLGFKGFKGVHTDVVVDFDDEQFIEDFDFTEDNEVIITFSFYRSMRFDIHVMTDNDDYVCWETFNSSGSMEFLINKKGTIMPVLG